MRCGVSRCYCHHQTAEADWRAPLVVVVVVVVVVGRQAHMSTTFREEREGRNIGAGASVSRGVSSEWPCKFIRRVYPASNLARRGVVELISGRDCTIAENTVPYAAQPKGTGKGNLPCLQERGILGHCSDMPWPGRNNKRQIHSGRGQGQSRRGVVCIRILGSDHRAGGLATVQDDGNGSDWRRPTGQLQGSLSGGTDQQRSCSDGTSALTLDTDPSPKPLKGGAQTMSGMVCRTIRRHLWGCPPLSRPRRARSSQEVNKESNQVGNRRRSNGLTCCFQRLAVCWPKAVAEPLLGLAGCCHWTARGAGI